MAQLQTVISPLNTAWTPDANLGLAGLDMLPQDERIVLSLLYVEELSVPETAAVMNCSEMEICQLHDRALRFLALRT